MEIIVTKQKEHGTYTDKALIKLLIRHFKIVILIEDTRDINWSQLKVQK